MPEVSETIEPEGCAASAAAPDAGWVDGIVIAIAPGFAEVHTAQGDLLCTYRGRLRRLAPDLQPLVAGRGATASARRKAGARRASSSPTPRQDVHGAAGVLPPSNAAADHVRIAPGDRVRILPLGNASGVVEALCPRRTTLTRSGGEASGGHVMLANLDQAVLVFAVVEPAPHFGMLDRYLALCEHAQIDITICFNKVDLGVGPEIAAAAKAYVGLGYRVLWTSALTGAHLTELRAQLHNAVSLMSGPSGVGKSSLINALVPEVNQRVGVVSQATRKGRHTTTGSRLLPLPGGGWLADSAGIRELALWNVAAADLPSCFVELRPVAGLCAFDDCAHGADEPGCALRQALADGAISPARFASFERLLREAHGDMDARS